MNSAICDPTEYVEGSTKYPLTLAGRINNENAKILKLAWVYSPIDEKNFIYNVQANPIFY